MPNGRVEIQTRYVLLQSSGQPFRFWILAVEETSHVRRNEAYYAENKIWYLKIILEKCHDRKWITLISLSTG